MKKIIIFITLFIIGINPVYASIEDLNLYSENILLYNIDTNQILYEQNMDKQVAIASLTKLFTIYFSLENIDDIKDTVKLSSNMFSGLAEAGASVAGFKAGEVVTYEDLLYGAMLPSGADATRALAISLFGSENEFATSMTNRMQELGLTHTSLKNSSGLTATGHYSSLNDILKLLLIALENNDFKTIYESRSYITSNGLLLKGTFQRYNELYSNQLDYIKGAKTGYTNEAGVCLASTAVKNNTNYILITTGAESYGSANTKHIMDAIAIYKETFNTYDYNTIYSNETIIKTIPLIYSNEKSYNITLKDDFIYLKKIHADYKIEYVGENEVNSLLKKDTIGTINIYEDDTLIYSENVYVNNISFSLLAFILTHKMIFLILLVTITLIFMLKKKRPKRL